MCSVKERFHKVMEAMGLSDYRVYTSVDGITQNMMVKLRNGKTSEVSTKILHPFLNKFTNVNANYIFTGRGSMFMNPLGDRDAEPEFLFHYTDIKGLAGIISSSLLKMSPFENSDDFRERKIENGTMKYLCFCTGPYAENNPVMWSKYATNNTGVCIKLNFKKLMKLNDGKKDLFRHFHVEYVDSKYIRIGADYCDPYRYKQSAWSFQSEYRFVSDSISCLDINEDIVESVIFGTSQTTSDTTTEEVKAIIGEAGKSCFVIDVRGEYVAFNITGIARLQWSDVRMRMGEIYNHIQMDRTKAQSEIEHKLENAERKIELLEKSLAAYEQKFATDVVKVGIGV